MPPSTARQDQQPHLGYRDTWFAVLGAYSRDEITLLQLNRLAKQFVNVPVSAMAAFSINQALERAREEVVRERASTSQTGSHSTTGTTTGAGTSSDPAPATSSTNPQQGGLSI